MTAAAITAKEISRAVPGTIHRQEQARSFSFLNLAEGRTEIRKTGEREGPDAAGGSLLFLLKEMTYTLTGR